MFDLLKYNLLEWLVTLAKLRVNELVKIDKLYGFNICSSSFDIHDDTVRSTKKYQKYENMRLMLLKRGIFISIYWNWKALKVKQRKRIVRRFLISQIYRATNLPGRVSVFFQWYKYRRVFSVFSKRASKQQKMKSTQGRNIIREIESGVAQATAVVAPEHFQLINNNQVSWLDCSKIALFYLQKWTKPLVWAVIVVTFSTSFVMSVNTGGPSLYNGVKSFIRTKNSRYAIWYL